MQLSISDKILGFKHTQDIELVQSTLQKLVSTTFAVNKRFWRNSSTFDSCLCHQILHESGEYEDRNLVVSHILYQNKIFP